MANANACPCLFCGRRYSNRRHDVEACWERTWTRLLEAVGLTAGRADR